jgi:transketolase
MPRCLRDFIFGIIFGHHPAYNVRYIALKRGCAADRLVLSEGHACPIIYAAAADLG